MAAAQSFRNLQRTEHRAVSEAMDPSCRALQ